MKKLNTIKKKFLLIFGLSLSLLFILLMISSFYLTNKNYDNIETRYLKNISDNLNNHLFHKIENLKKNLLTISNDQSLTLYNKTEKDSILDYFLLRFTDYISIISFLDKNGNEIIRQKNGKIIAIKDNVKTNPLYAKSFGNLNEVLLSEVKYINELKAYGVEVILQKTNYFNDEFEGMIYGVIPFEQLIKSLLPIDKELSIRIVDKNNIIIFSSKQDETFQKIDLSKIKKDILMQANILNEASIAYSRFILDKSATLIMSKNYDTFISELNNLIGTQLIIFLIIISIVIIFVYFYIQKSINTPIDFLMKSISLISNGNYSHKITINTNDEIETLGKSFNLMNENLQNSQLKLKEKEKDLENVNLELSKLVSKQESKIKEQILTLRKKDTLLFEQSKMASMGEMINNIAHQWRQPLSIISTLTSGLQLIKLYKPLEEKEIDKTLADILKNTTYLSETIDNFRSFIKGEDNHILFNLDENINKNLSILDSSFRISNISPILNLNTNLNIENYPNDLTQVFINLVNNAKDALDMNNYEKKYIFISSEIDNNEVIIKVKDNAKGIPENILKKVFEPYFTTKHQSQGTGLGLYMSYKIVTEHMKGKISVHNVSFNYDNEEFTGAEFIINLPLNS